MTLDLVDGSRIVGTVTGQEEHAFDFAGIPILHDVEEFEVNRLSALGRSRMCERALA